MEECGLDFKLSLWAKGLFNSAGLRASVRFNALKNVIEGISQKIVAQTLRRLEYSGLVSRTAYATVPVTVEYAITPLGRSLIDLVEPFREWAINNIGDVERARVAMRPLG